MNYELLFQRIYLPKDIQIVQSQIQRKTTPAIEGQIEERWQAVIQNAPSVFNGLCYRLCGFDASDHLTLDVSQITYRESQCLPVEYIFGHYSPEYYSHSMACSIFLETTDNYIVFGKKGEQHRIIGGAYSPNELSLFDGTSLFQMPKIEIYEELGVPPEYVEHLLLLGCVRTSHLNAALVFRGSLPFSKIEVEQYFNKGHDPELDALVFIKKDSLHKYFRDFHPYKQALLTCME